MVKIREKVYRNHEISSLLPRNAWKLFDAFADLFAIPHGVFLQGAWSMEHVSSLAKTLKAFVSTYTVVGLSLADERFRV